MIMTDNVDRFNSSSSDGIQWKYDLSEKSQDAVTGLMRQHDFEAANLERQTFLFEVAFHFCVVPKSFNTGNTLPWRASSPLGVMQGQCSDLLIGLPWPIVESHVPLRLLVIVESSQQSVTSALARGEPLASLVRNGLIQFVYVDPLSADVNI